MWTEVDKYERIQRYLSGQMAPHEVTAFEIDLTTQESLRTDLEMHRLANEVIVDRYLLNVKATTQKVIQQKAIEKNIRNWGLGLGLGAILTAGVWFYSQDHQMPEVSTTFKQKETAIVPPIQEQESAKAIDGVKKDDRKDRVEKAVTVQEAVPSSPYQATSTEPDQLPPPIPLSSVPSVPEKPLVTHELPRKQEIAPIESTSKPDIQPTTDEGEKPRHAMTLVELVLNPLQGTEVELPVDADFTGDFTVFDPTGASVYRCSIQNGQPNTWDGKVISGGTAAAGQYGFILKSSSGRETVGYVTVVR